MHVWATKIEIEIIQMFNIRCFRPLLFGILLHLLASKNYVALNTKHLYLDAFALLLFQSNNHI